MLSPRLTNCQGCSEIPGLLKKIDCKLAELGSNMYNNIVFMLGYDIPATKIMQLISYKRILIFKYCNLDYAGNCSIGKIKGKVIRLTAGCVSKCNQIKVYTPEIPNPEVTTTTTTTSL